MRDDQRFEIERAFDLLPHVIGSSWAVIWFRFNGIKHPTKEEYRHKVIEYFQMLEPLLGSLKGKEFEEMNRYIELRRNSEIERIKNGENKEVEKRYARYVDYG